MSCKAKVYFTEQKAKSKNKSKHTRPDKGVGDREAQASIRP